MSIDFSGLYGNQRLKDFFGECIENNALPHAFILEGGKGSGKLTFAQQIAAASLCSSMQKPCKSCINCKHVFNLIAPDVQYVDLPEDKSSIPVESVRFIKSDAQSVPVEGELKFYIISNSDKMTVQAQNALLKILEEPPAFVVFILLTESSNLLLPTIRSRAPVFRMQTFSDEEIIDYIGKHVPYANGTDEKRNKLIKRLIKSSVGCIGPVLEGISNQSSDDVDDLNETITGFFESLAAVDRSRFMGYEDKLPGKREELSDFLKILRSAARDLLCSKKSIMTSVFFDDSDDSKKLAKPFTLKSLIEIYDLTEEALRLNELNSNINSIKINYMCKVWRSVHL